MFDSCGGGINGTKLAESICWFGVVNGKGGVLSFLSKFIDKGTLKTFELINK